MRMQVIVQRTVCLKKIEYDLTVETFLSVLQITNDSDYSFVIKTLLQTKAKAQAKKKRGADLFSVHGFF